MKTIWKFQLQLTDSQSIRMPEKSEILTVQMQGNTPCLWALVDSELPSEGRVIEVYGTGHPVNEVGERRYIATFQSGMFVWHVFERVL